VFDGIEKQDFNEKELSES